ncbi:hypothetical protein EGT07_04375 [Herbaspirillum sp. HC18]|nr:hypothetical protein EGT07_04375 [Herbaspirillum sp. HC18]
MTERVEWELVDAPAASGKRHAGQATREALHALLGRQWKWKIAGTAIVTLLMVALLATLTGAVVLLFVAGTLLSVGIRKLKAWFGYGGRSSNLMER